MQINTKKGVSPLIATTILVGFAVVITTGIFFFGTDILEDIKEKQGATAEISFKCTGMHFKVANVQPGDQIVVDNDGQEEIKAFMLRLFDGNNNIAVDNHHKISILPGSRGTIQVVPPPGFGEVSKVKVFAKSYSGPTGKTIWGVCSDTETTVTI
jgi:hypothetical protein